ncbi:MAG: tripartite tricarboxylate transporter TctB family protein [Alkalispirochaeta sp.]
MSRDVRNDLIVAGIFAILSVGVIIGTSDYPVSERAVGIRTFPLILALLLGGLSILVIVRSVLILRKMPRNEDQAGPAIDKRVVTQIVITVVGVAVYIAVVSTGGFIITSVLYLGVMAYYFGERRLWMVATYAIVGVISVYLLFGVLARVPFPEGPAEQILSTIGLG